MLIVWNRLGGRKIDVVWRTPGRAAVEYALDGQSRTVAGFDGKALRGVDLEPSTPRIFRISR